jgi:lysophospholipase L1-like esterase
MYNNNKGKIIVFSVSINIILILMIGIMFYKNWSFFAVKNKAISIFVKNNIETHSPYYLEKVSQFKNFKIDNNSIVFVGDSITDMGDWYELFNNNKIVNMGINGDTIQGILDRINIITNGQPKKIFIMVGTNDLSGKESIDTLSSKYEKILSLIKEKSPNAHIYIQSVLPVNNIVWKDSSDINFFNRKEKNGDILLFNNALKRLTIKYNAQYINLHDLYLDKNNNLDLKYTVDGLHLNGQGYLIWKQAIEQYVNSQ